MSLSNPADRRGNRPGQPRLPQSESPRTSGSGSHPPTTKRPEQRIGQYIIKKTLGEGSFGKVKLAVHRISGQEVALKIISRKKLISRDMAGRVEREIQYLQLLRHPHIIKLYEIWRMNGNVNGHIVLSATGIRSSPPRQRSSWCSSMPAGNSSIIW